MSYSNHSLQLYDARALAEALAAHPSFGELGRTVHEDMIAASEIHHLNEGELLYAAGARAECVFIVLKGVLQIEYPPPGKTRGYAAAILQAPFILGEAQALDARPWSGTGVALSPIVALAVSVSALEALMSRHARLGWVLYKELAHRFLGAIESWKTHLEATPSEALAQYLVRYVAAMKSAPGSSEGLLRIRQADLGRATGLRRETVNRLLREWSKAGVLRVEARGLSGVDLDALKKQLGAGGARKGSRALARTAARRRSSARVK